MNTEFPLALRFARRHLLSAACYALWLVFTPGCDRAGGRAAVERPESVSPFSPPSAQSLAGFKSDIDEDASNSGAIEPSGLVSRLEKLRTRGRIDEFVTAVLEAPATFDEQPTVQLLKTEALLALGRNDEAASMALEAATSANHRAETGLCSQALKLWSIACLRTRQPLVDSLAESLLADLPREDVVAETIRFWRRSLSARPAYARDAPGSSGRVEVPSARATVSSVSEELSAIEARANGVTMPLVFIDTGAQHTLMTSEAAHAAGVVVGSSKTQLVGFAGLNAQPGMLQTLQLGDLTLRDVPVLVGDSAPLVAANGQMALGTELMHHVRFTIDYPRQRVFAEAADAGPRAGSRPAWNIPLWTFSQACLAQGQLASGAAARVLVDTGNRTGTFMSPRWARRSLPSFQRAQTGMVFKFKQRKTILEGWTLGDRLLAEWPVADTIPAELERLNLVDVLVGRDVLYSYEVTIDLAARVLELRTRDPTPAPAEH